MSEVSKQNNLDLMITGSVTPQPQTLALSNASIQLVPDVRPHQNVKASVQVCGNCTLNR